MLLKLSNSQRDFLFWAKLHVTAHEPKYQAFQGVSQQKSVQKFAMRRDFEQLSPLVRLSPNWDGFRAFLRKTQRCITPHFFCVEVKRLLSSFFVGPKKWTRKAWPPGQVVKPSPKVELLVNALAVVRRVDGEESIGWWPFQPSLDTLRIPRVRHFFHPFFLGIP